MTTFPKNSRVIFIGDSITARCSYAARVVEHYNKYLPELNVKFAVGAAAGSSLDDALRFFDAHVLPFKPTHATVFFGVNDAHLDALEIKAPDERYAKLKHYYDKYRKNLDIYLDLLIANGITPTLIAPAPYAEYMSSDTPAILNGHRVLYEYAELVRETASRRGLDLIDFHSRLNELYMIDDVYTADRVHPSEHGQYRMAECLLRSQGLRIDEYRPIEEILSDSFIEKWYGCCRPLVVMYAAYVCLMTDIYEKNSDEQISIMRRALESGEYDSSPARREMAEHFVKFKPREAELRAQLNAICGDQ